MQAIHAIISGRVQGVSFRAFVSAWANELRLKGFVKNLHTGEVEIIAEGEKQKLEEFIKILEKGAPSSHIKEFRIEWISPSNNFSDFSIEY